MAAPSALTSPLTSTGSQRPLAGRTAGRIVNDFAPASEVAGRASVAIENSLNPLRAAPQGRALDARTAIGRVYYASNCRNSATRRISFWSTAISRSCRSMAGAREESAPLMMLALRGPADNR